MFYVFIEALECFMEEGVKMLVCLDSFFQNGLHDKSDGYFSMDVAQSLIGLHSNLLNSVSYRLHQVNLCLLSPHRKTLWHCERLIMLCVCV